MYGLDYVALRYFNVYGERMDVHGAYTEVLVRWMERIDAGQPPMIFGDGRQTMDFIHVETSPARTSSRHITELLAGLKRDGRLAFRSVATPMTYHDPCQISRRGGATGDARELMTAIASDFREMSPTGNYNWCCGGGGGVQAIGRAADVRHDVFRIKIAQVEATGGAAMVSACSNCRLTMDESKTALHWGGRLESLVELLADKLDRAEGEARGNQRMTVQMQVVRLYAGNESERATLQMKRLSSDFSAFSM